MRQRIRRGGVVVIVLLALAQAYQPDRSNPTTSASSIWEDPTVPRDVLAVFERSCADCHSHETRWPWYSRVAPISWLSARDVNEGRRHLNFSMWSELDPYRRFKLLEEICEEVEEGEMPLAIYTLLHSGAKLSAAEVETLCAWTKSSRDELRGQIGDQPENESHKESHDH
jgi:Haem-binding domain